MSAAYQIIFSSIGKAFSTMANWEIMPGVSLLAFFIALIVLHLILRIIWIDARSDDKSDKGKGK